MHVGFTDQRVDDQSNIMGVDRSQELPIARPRVHLNLGKACADALVPRHSPSGAAASSLLAYRTFVRRYKFGECDSLFRIFRRRNDSIADLELCPFHFQCLGCPNEKILSELVRCTADWTALLSDGSAGEPLAARGRHVRVAPN